MALPARAIATSGVIPARGSELTPHLVKLRGCRLSKGAGRTGLSWRRRLQVSAKLSGSPDSTRNLSSLSKSYSTLGLQPAANMKDIKSAYRELAFQYHPDLNTSPDATEKFLEIRQAYETALSTQKNPSDSSKPSGSRTKRKTKRSKSGKDDMFSDLFGDWM